MLPEAIDEMYQSLKEDFANPSANHELADASKEKIELIRNQIADELDAFPSEVIFTSGATESNNLILKAFAGQAISEEKKPHIITSKIEHKCILVICQYLESIGCQVTYLSPDQSGIISPKSVQSAIKSNTVLVSLMHVNNELGTVNPIREYGKICFEQNVAFHTDAAQSFLKTPLNVEDDYIDALSLSAHKIGGPKGIGVAYIRELRNKTFPPLIHGAGQEHGVRGGTLATPLIVGFGAASRGFRSRYETTPFSALKLHLLELLKLNKIKFNVNGKGRTLPSCVSLTFRNVDVEGVIRQSADRYCISQSSACSAGTIEPSHVLSALGLDREASANTLRISFSFETTHEHIGMFVEALVSLKTD